MVSVFISVCLMVALAYLQTTMQRTRGRRAGDLHPFYFTIGVCESEQHGEQGGAILQRSVTIGDPQFTNNGAADWAAPYSFGCLWHVRNLCAAIQPGGGTVHVGLQLFFIAIGRSQRCVCC